MLEVGSKARVLTDDRHPKGQIVVVLKTAPNAQDGKPYYCQTYGGLVCSCYGDEDLEEVTDEYK